MSPERLVSWRRAAGAVVLGLLVGAAAVLGVRSGLIPTGRSRSDVVFILIDTLRADHVSCYGYGRDTTPNIDSVAADGITLLNNKAQSGVTMISMTSIFKSRFTIETVVGHKKAANDFTFAEVMRDAGYLTAGIQTNPWLTGQMGQFPRGFSRYSVLTPPEKTGMLRSAEWTGDVTENVFYVDAGIVADRCVETIGEERDKPLFLYAHFMDPHGPYIPPAEFQQYGQRPLGIGEASELSGRWAGAVLQGRPEEAEAVKEEITALYDAEIAYTDAAVGRIVDALKEAGMYDNAVIVIAADHGEGLLEHGRVLHANSLYEELIHTPLIIKIPGREPERYEGLTRNVDIAPTVFEACGIEPGWGRRDGMALSEVLDGRKSIVESAAMMRVTIRDEKPEHRSLQYGNLKYITVKAPWNPSGRKLFDLADDPGEQTDILSERPGDAEKLAERLAALAAEPEEEDDVEIDPETRKRLEALGYLGN